MTDLHPFDAGITRAMDLLRRRVQTEIRSMMGAAERNGADYIATAMGAVATLAEEQTMLFACIQEPEYRRAMVDELYKRMIDAVEIRHAQLCAEQGVGGNA